MFGSSLANLGSPADASFVCQALRVSTFHALLQQILLQLVSHAIRSTPAALGVANLDLAHRPGWKHERDLAHS